MTSNSYDAIILGAGAAGLMTAAVAGQRERMLGIADKCPVHRTLMGDLRVETRLAD